MAHRPLSQQQRPFANTKNVARDGWDQGLIQAAMPSMKERKYAKVLLAPKPMDVVSLSQTLPVSMPVRFI